MDNFGFFRVGAYVPQVKIGDLDYNTAQIADAVKKAAGEEVECLVFPELSITGYTCADLFEQELLMSGAEEAVARLAEATKKEDILFAIGTPVSAFGKRYNCAVLIYMGSVVGIIPKSYLPNYGEFYEKRWFKSGKDIKEALIDYAGQNQVPFGTNLIFKYKGTKIGVEICEDLWVPSPPSSRMAMAGANIILNLSASDEIIGKHQYLISLISQQSARCRCAYVYSSAGWGESSTDLVFIGKAVIAEDGIVYGGENKFMAGPIHEYHTVDLQRLNLDRAKFQTFTEDEEDVKEFWEIEILQSTEKKGEKLKSKIKLENINPLPFVPSNPATLNKRCEEIINIQSYGLMRRLDAIGCKKAVVGISGGLDSTLALLVTVNAFDIMGLSREGIIAITMPGLGTTSRTKNNAQSLMEALGVTALEIPIGEAVELHFRDIGQDPKKYDVTFENSQARERTQILMDVANKEGAIVIGTGDMSELALGWCTYNGDQMSMYGVNASVPKTLVRHLVKWFASQSSSNISMILEDICDTPISPELVPSSTGDIAQKTEDFVGPYELHDFFLYNFLRNSFSPKKILFLAEKAFENKYDREEILKWLKVFLKRFFSQQFKRSCMPDGPKVGSVNLSPRGDWRMPSDASVNLWLSQLEELKED